MPDIATASENLPELPEAVTSYLNELAADIAAHGGFQDRDPTEVIKEAHERRQAFIREMLEGTTDRSKMAREILMTEIWISGVAEGARERALRGCEGLYWRSNRPPLPDF